MEKWYTWFEMIISNKCYSYHDQAFILVPPEPRAAESIAELSSSKWDMLQVTNATDTAIKLNYSCYQGR